MFCIFKLHDSKIRVCIHLECDSLVGVYGFVLDEFFEDRDLRASTSQFSSVVLSCLHLQNVDDTTHLQKVCL